MKFTLSESGYQRISQKYPATPSYEEFVEMFTEFAFFEVKEHEDKLRSNFNWEYVMPRVARSSVKSHCRRAGMRPPQDYARIVHHKLSALYASHGIQSSALSGG